MALPTMSTVLDGATAHIKEPISKMEIATRNTPLIYERKNMVSNLPCNGLSTVVHLR